MKHTSRVSREIRLYLHVMDMSIISRANRLLPTGLHSSSLVVEPFPIRDLVADFPINIIFKLSRLGIFHPCVVVDIALRSSQQLNRFSFIRHRMSSQKITMLSCPTSFVNASSSFPTVQSYAVPFA